MTCIVAIDPGPKESALVIWNGKHIQTAVKEPNDDIRFRLSERYHRDVVCERVESYGMAVGREVFETCFWTGRFWEASAGGFLLVPRREVKLHVCGRPQAKDANIRQALIDRFGAKGTKKDPGLTYQLKADTWQAFALAVTTFDRWSPEFREQFLAGSTPQNKETKA